MLVAAWMVKHKLGNERDHETERVKESHAPGPVQRRREAAKRVSKVRDL